MKKYLIVIVVIISVSLLLYTKYRGISYNFNSNSVPNVQKPTPKGDVVAKIALLADSHIDYQRLEKSLIAAKKYNVSSVVHVGDLSDFGGILELTKTKNILDASGIPYYVLPGDRDVVEGGKNFNKIFADKLCNLSTLSKYKIVCLQNPYNYTLLDEDYLQDFYKSLQVSDIVISSQPIYNPNSNVYMGFYNESVKLQGDDIYSKIKNSNISYVFSGDAHFFSKFNDSKIEYYNLGAITDKKNLQTPSFTLLNVLTDGVIVEQININ